MNIVCKLQTPNLHFTVSSAVARGSLCYEGYFHKFQEAPTEKSEFVLCVLIFPAMRLVSSARKCQSINMNDFFQTCKRCSEYHLALQEKQSATGPSQSAPPHITRLLGRGSQIRGSGGDIFPGLTAPGVSVPGQAGPEYVAGVAGQLGGGARAAHCKPYFYTMDTK